MKPEAVSLAKITQPKFSGVFQRKRLFALLDRCRKKPVIWVCGPPGAGKTILISSFIEAQVLPCIWYQIDNNDEDIATFFFYMGIAAKQAAPRYQKPLPNLTPEYLSGLPTFTRNFFLELYSRLHPRLKNNPHSPPFYSPLNKGGDRGVKGGIISSVPSFTKGGLGRIKKGGFVIVLDNYQDLSADSQLHAVMLNAIAAIPEGANIIFISRSEPPKAFSGMKANGLIETIGWKDLSLTPEEYTGIVRLKIKDKKPHPMNRETEELAYEAYTKTKGWAAGLALMLEAIRKGGFDYKKISSIGTDTVFDYFGTEILERLDEDTRNFLLKSAILPVMSPQMAGELADISNADRILTDLSHNNCFTEKHSHINPVYQYHPLFREFLISKARDSFGNEGFSMLQKKAASILYEAGRLEDAFSLFRDCLEWEGIARLVMGHAPELIKQGRGKVVEEWIANLPEHVLNTYPWLLYWLGICHMPLNLTESRRHLEKAFAFFKEQKNTAGIYLCWSGIVNCLTLALEDLKPLDNYIPMLDELIHTFGGFPSEEIGARAASSMFMAMVYRQPQHPEIDSWGERALELSEKCGDRGLKSMALTAFAFNKIASGKFKEVAFAIESYHSMAQSKEATPLIMLMMKWVEAIYLTATASHERCLKAIDEGLRLSASTGVYIMDFLLMGHGTLSSLSAGDIKTAERFLKKMDSFFGRMRSSDKGFYHFLWGYYFLQKKDIKQAAIHADNALKYAFDTGFLVAEEFAYLEKAYVLHELKEHDKALHYLKECQRIALHIKYRHMEYISLLTEAQFVFDAGDKEPALALLRKAFAIGRELGYVNIYLIRPDNLAHLCSKALEAGIETEYVQELIKRRNLFPEAAPVDIENWPYAIKIFTLSRFNLVRDGRTIMSTKKSQQKPIAMLKAMIALGGREVREDELNSILWPEADGDSAHKAFAVNLHRLRRLIGNEKAIILRDGKITIDPHYCYVDAWLFERLIGKAEAALKQGAKDDAICLIERAASIYNNPFFHDETAPWADKPRKRLQNKFIRYMERLGMLYEEKGEFEMAIDIFKKAIEVAPISEGLYQSLMLCFDRLGRRAEALVLYNNLKENLSSVLGVEPSAMTKSIYNTLISK